jgi:hypothetical protein
MKHKAKPAPSFYIAAEEGDRFLLKGSDYPPEGVWYVVAEQSAEEEAAAEAAELAAKSRFKVGDHVRFDPKQRLLGMRQPEARPYLITKIREWNGFFDLEGYGLPVHYSTLIPTRRRRTNVWKELGDEWKKFVAEIERGECRD